MGQRRCSAAHLVTPIALEGRKSSRLQSSSAQCCPGEGNAAVPPCLVGPRTGERRSAVAWMKTPISAMVASFMGPCSASTELGRREGSGGRGSSHEGRKLLRYQSTRRRIGPAIGPAFADPSRRWTAGHVVREPRVVIRRRNPSGSRGRTESPPRASGAPTASEPELGAK